MVGNIGQAEHLLEIGRYGETITLCGQLPDTPARNHVLATALFKQYGDQRLDDVIGSYTKAIERKPFADSYFFRGTAYKRKAGILEDEYKNHPSPEVREMIQDALERAEHDFIQAGKMQPRFRKIITRRLKRVWESKLNTC